MSFQIPITIKQAIENIESSRFLLPAIQREFIWSSEKIEWLFDSIMRNYPISSFLFWKVEGGTKKGYKFYKFINEYRERYKTHNEEIKTDGINDFEAVLDGQQRLTSLYIGLKGSYAYKEPRKWWEDTEIVIPTRDLYLNIECALTEQEDGRVYEFKFLKREDTKQIDIHNSKWFRVGKILGLTSIYEFNKFISEHNLNQFAQETISKLHEAIHSKLLINYFLESEQNIDKALNIFIRINSGGEPLDFSDLILSIAIANWEKKDARQEIYKLVDNIRDKGFTISKDFILRTFLYLYSTNIKFKVTNFSTQNAIRFEKEWEKIRKAILCIFDLVNSFGFIDSTLTSKNALLPIIYYVYHQKYDDFSTKTEYIDERDTIKRWLLAVTVKRLFGGTSEGFLVQIRKAFTDNIDTEHIKSNINNFPVEQIKEKVTSDMSMSDDFIEKLLYTQKDDKYAFSILALLYQNLDYKNNNFDKDHLHPIISFDKVNLDKLAIDQQVREEYFENSHYNNSILNLQMLDSNENKSKQAKQLEEWLNSKQDKTKTLETQLIPDASFKLEDFPVFIEARKELLVKQLKQLL